MASEIIIDVKINKPFLKDFIISMYKSNPVIASSGNTIGIFIKQLLEKPPKNLKYNKNNNDCYLSILLPNYKDISVNSCNYISDDNQNLFTRFLFSLFKDLFFQYITDRLRLGFQKKDSILQFCYDYNISFNHANYESLKKLYDRNLKNKEILNKNNKKMSQHLSNEFTAKLIFTKKINDE